MFPSLFEGFGLVALEAQISNLPVIASDKIPMGYW
ncbi:glycosyltransferase [Lacticaseibacillus paracasei]